MKLRTGLIVGGVVAALLLSASYIIYRLKQQMYAEHLTALNLAAKADTTQHRLVGELAVARRQVEQLGVQLDTKTHDAHETGVALARLRLQFDSLRKRGEGSADLTPAGQIILTGELDVWDSAGFRVGATASAKMDTAGGAIALGPSLWAWRLERRAIDLTVDFSCHRDTALVHVTGPPWAQADLTEARQDPGICNPPPRFSLFALKLPSVPVGAGLVGLGFLLGRSVAR